MFNSVGERTPPCGLPVLNWHCEISICCVGFASFDVVCDKLNECVCSSFLISMCMFIVSKALLIECYSDCSLQGTLLVECLCNGVV